MQLALFFDESISENELVNLPLGLIGASPSVGLGTCTGLAGIQEFPPLLVGM